MHPKRPPAKAILWVKCRLPTPAPPGETPASYTKHACGMTPCGMFSSRWRWENKGRLKAQGGQSRSPAEYRARGAQVPLRPESGLEEMLGSNASARPHGGVSQRRFPSTRSRSPLGVVRLLSLLVLKIQFLSLQNILKTLLSLLQNVKHLS